MKKTLALVAMILCLVMVLASCGNIKSAKIDDYLNPDYTPEDVVLKKSNYISEVEGYELAETNGSFAVFTKITLPDLLANPDAKTTVSYKLFSLAANKVIASVAGTNIECDFSFDENAPIATVQKNTFNQKTGDVTETTYTAYDAAGNQLVYSTKAIAAAREFADDLVLFNNATYQVDEETGALTKIKDVPEYVTLAEYLEYNDKYFYAGNENKIVVYDRDFNFVAHWSAPSYAAEEMCNINLLNDGNVLIQYYYELDSDAAKYDIYEVNETGITVKYDLVSLIFNPAKNSTKKLDLDFLVYSVTTNADLQKDFEEGNSKFSAEFENIAYICPIVDKKIDYSDDAMDLVITDNKLGAMKSLKILDNQATSGPRKVATDLYAVSLKIGYALVNGKGEVVNVINNESLKLKDDYIVGEKTIYNYDLTVAYDLAGNDASVLGYMGDSILVKSNRSNGYDIILLTEGSQKTVHSHTEKIIVGTNVTTTEVVIEFLYDEGNNFYCIHNSVSGYSYYNANGDLIISTQQPMNMVASYENTVLLKGTSALAADVYFTFTEK